MSKQSEAIPWDQLTLLPEGSHVRTYQSQGNGLESGTAPAQDSGQSFTESFANYDPDTCSWRTSALSLFGGWMPYLENLPRAGTMLNGSAYQLVPLVPRTYATGCSFLPTPRSQGGYTESLKMESLVKRGEKHQWGNLAEWLAQKHGLKPSPSMVEQMMGYPLGWTDLEDSETP